MSYVIARINDDLFASEIAKGIDVLLAITWVTDKTDESEDDVPFSMSLPQVQNVIWQWKSISTLMFPM